MDKSVHGQLTPRPEVDKIGHSDESIEGIVADHKTFNQTISESEEFKGKRIKKVLYSEKSESSVEEMMDDTPSNYNIANGRLDGRVMGLKAIMLYAKNQGV